MLGEIVCVCVQFKFNGKIKVFSLAYKEADKQTDNPNSQITKVQNKTLGWL